MTRRFFCIYEEPPNIETPVVLYANGCDVSLAELEKRKFKSPSELTIYLHGIGYIYPSTLCNPEALDFVYIALFYGDDKVLYWTNEIDTDKHYALYIAAKRMKQTRKKIQDWMKEEGEKLNLVQASQCPTWGEYLKAQEHFDNLVELIEIG